MHPNYKLCNVLKQDMDQVIPNLWLGSFPSRKRLQANTNDIQSILSIMKEKVNVTEVRLVPIRLIVITSSHAAIAGHHTPSDSNRRYRGRRCPDSLLALYSVHTRRTGQRETCLGSLSGWNQCVSSSASLFSRLSLSVKVAAQRFSQRIRCTVEI
jgi:hypothetical protein